MAIGLELDENLVLAMKKKKNERFPSISNGALISPRRFRRSCQGCSDTFARQQPALICSCNSGGRASKLSAVERSSIQRAALKIAVWLRETIGIGIQTKSAEGARLIHILRQFSQNISLN